MKNQDLKAVESPFFGTNRTELVPTACFSVESMKSLFAVVTGLSADAREIEFAKLTPQPKQSLKEFNQIKTTSEALFVPKIFLTTYESEMFSSSDPSIFDDPKIPVSVKLIVIDSCPEYMVQLNRRPANWLRIELDLTKPEIFDLNLGPSEPTPNQSNFVINGQDGNWSRSAHSKLTQALSEARTHRSILHRRNIYDIYILFGVFPIIFFLFLRITPLASPHLDQLPDLNRFLLFFWIFILLITLFRIAFNYTRWVFPYIEFVGRNHRKHWTQLIWAAITVPIIGGLVWQAFVSLSDFLLGR